MTEKASKIIGRAKSVASNQNVKSGAYQNIWKIFSFGVSSRPKASAVSLKVR